MSVHDKDAEAKAKALFGIPEDEPIFVLRAQDRLYGPMLAIYEQLYVSAIRTVRAGAFLDGDEMEFADHVGMCYDEGRRWQKANEDRVKIPD